MSQAIFYSLSTTLIDRNYYPHYMNVNTETQGGKVTCLRSHSESVVEEEWESQVTEKLSIWYLFPECGQDTGTGED